MPLVASPVAALDLDDLLDPSRLIPAYQPIVALAETGTRTPTVAYEALARWPGIDGADPGSVFSLAREQDRLAELDRACRTAAVRHAAPWLGDGLALFVNLEPCALEVDGVAGSVLPEEARGLRIVVELTERDLVRRPAELLAMVQRARDLGWGVALDDVGANRESLALLPLVAPDVVKLDLSLVQGRPDAEQAGIMTAVMAHAERTGATILAEGIEDRAHVDQALALGATLGQGWHFGRPGPLRQPRSAAPAISLAARHEPTPASPFDLVAGRAVRIGRKGLLLDLSLHLETQGRRHEPAPVVLGAFQHARHFTPATVVRYSHLAARCPLVAALGAGLTVDRVPGLRGVDLAADDPLVDEWTVVVVGPHYAGALIARDLGDGGPDAERRFQFVVTHDRDLVEAAARSLLSRIAPA
jgi:EAL domain-containing protein (putative c-di-GMP-specific phosphodiesterase class I)